MKNYPELANEKEVIVSGLDTIVVQKMLDGIRGGRSLDLEGFDASATVIKAGHVIIRDTVNDTFKPMPVADGAYDSLPANHEYVGILGATVTRKAPMASIVTIGTINEVACPYAISTIKAAFKAAVPTIVFTKD